MAWEYGPTAGGALSVDTTSFFFLPAIFRVNIITQRPKTNNN